VQQSWLGVARIPNQQQVYGTCGTAEKPVRNKTLEMACQLVEGMVAASWLTQAKKTEYLAGQSW